jgi:hypothetical protein
MDGLLPKIIYIKFSKGTTWERELCWKVPQVQINVCSRITLQTPHLLLVIMQIII